MIEYQKEKEEIANGCCGLIVVAFMICIISYFMYLGITWINNTNSRVKALESKLNENK
jgi:hypothetical protein